jgi:hypothetical protein
MKIWIKEIILTTGLQVNSAKGQVVAAINKYKADEVRSWYRCKICFIVKEVESKFDLSDVKIKRRIKR